MSRELIADLWEHGGSEYLRLKRRLIAYREVVWLSAEEGAENARRGKVL